MKKRTVFTLNDIVIYNDYAEIVLYDRYNNEKCRALIDLDDIDKVKKYKWGLENNYVSASINGKRVKLHRLIMNCPDDKLIDHINHNTLDNRKINLRICTSSQNQMNTNKRIDNSSGVKGVNWNKSKERWQAYITIDKKYIYLGTFKNKDDAIKARNEAEEKYQKDFRRLG